MKLIGINLLKPGEKLASAVYSASGKAIVNAGVVMTESYIDRLKKLGIYNIYVDDDDFKDIELVEAVSINSRAQANKVFRQVYDLFHKGKSFDEYTVVDAVKQIIDEIKANGTTSISTLSSMVMDNYLASHSVNVCILSILIGNNMNYNFNQLLDLGVGALIHDIAREEESKESIDHIQKGFDVIKRYKGISLYSSKVIYEHHENCDGSGYPRGIEGDSISKFSKIVSIVDFYDTLTLGPDGKPQMLPHEAFEVILAESDKRFDADTVECFRNAIAFYPNGCAVKLSNGQKGVVVTQNKGAPQRPVVRIVEGDEIRKDVNLLTNLTIFIEKVEEE